MRFAGILAVISFLMTAVHSDENAKSEWQADLEYLSEALDTRHIDPFHTLSKEAFEAEITRLGTKGEMLTPEQKRVELMRLIRRIGDGHTALPLWSDTLRRFTFEVRYVEDQFLVTGTMDQHEDVLGAVLTSINGTPIEEIATNLQSIVPFVENQQSLQLRTAMYILIDDLLIGLGFAQPDKPSTLTFRKGDRVYEIEAQSVSYDTYAQSVSHTLSQSHPEQYFERQFGNDTLWFGSDDESQTVYVKFDRYPPAENMMAFGEALYKHAVKAETQHLIIDLRENFGGDFFTGLILASYLNLIDSVEWQDGVYVLISEQTFSAAMSNAAQFRQILNAKLVGTPTGARPCGYQDMGQFALPHSGWVVTYSKRRFCFIDSEEDAILPDHFVQAGTADYVDGHDPVLTWTLKDIAGDLKMSP